MTKSPKYFIQIPVSTAKQSDIRPVDKLVFGEVYTMLNTTDKFFMSSQRLSKRIGVNRSTVLRSIKRLVNKGYVKTQINIHKDNKYKRFIYDPQVVGKNGRGKMHQPVVAKRHNGRGKMHQPVVAKRHTNISINKPIKRISKNTSQGILEKEFTDADNLVQQKWTMSIPSNKRMLIVRLIVKFGYQQVKKAINTTYDNGIGINGMPNYVKAVVLSNQNKPKRRPHTYSYNHQPIKQHVPDWAKDGYHEKLHPTSKKLQRKIQKQLKDLKNRGNKK